MSSSHHPQIPRRLIPCLIVIWLIIFGFGYAGHRLLHNSVADSLFKSLQLFELHYSPHPGAEGSAIAGDVPWEIEASRFAGALWGLTLLPVLLGMLFEEPLYRWWVGRFWKRHYVVCGECSRTLALVRDLRRQRKRVVLLGHCRDSREAFPSGVLYLEGDSGDPHLLNKSAVHRAHSLIALHEVDRANIETIVAAGNLCARRPASDTPLNAFAHIADARLQLTLKHLGGESAGLAGKKVREHFFNYYELIARLLLRRFPMPPALSESRPRPEHIIIVGFAAFGQSVALRIVKMTQQLYRQCAATGTQWHVAKPRLTVVDPCAEALLSEFERLHPHFRDFCELDYRTIDTTDRSFLDWSFLDGDDPATRSTLIFCLENETVTLRAISLIADISSSAACPVDSIYLRIAQPERLGPILEKLQPEGARKPHIRYFAPDSEVFNADVLLNQSQDLLAREIHNAYLRVEAADRRANNQPTAAGKSWDELAETDRESNREAADHLWAKLYVLGYELQEVRPGMPDPGSSLVLLSKLKEREEELARAEHCRWMTWRVLDGWAWGEKRDPVAKLHPDILDYDQLQDSTKAKDRANVKVIPTLLSEGRLKAVIRGNHD